MPSTCLATRMAILREIHGKGYITKFSEPLYTDLTHCDRYVMCNDEAW